MEQYWLCEHCGSELEYPYEPKEVANTAVCDSCYQEHEEQHGIFRSNVFHTRAQDNDLNWGLGR